MKGGGEESLHLHEEPVLVVAVLGKHALHLRVRARARGKDERGEGRGERRVRLRMRVRLRAYCDNM